ncbi:MAG TPA: DUF4340 domain-containing protein [Vicinamibacteria bacterium]|nr:DUF4340 domain-containing protein [Vicinamibacteria bacterium]
MAAAVTRKKKPAFLGTYVALAVAAALGAYLYFVDAKRPAGDEKPKEKLFSFEKAKAKALTVNSAGQPEIRLVKAGQGWRMEAPLASPADASEVDAIVSGLDGLELSEVVAETPAALKDYGLDPPKGTVQVAVEGQAEPVTLQVGEKTPDGGSLYAKVPARARVFTIPAYLEGALLKKPIELRDREVLHVKRDKIRSLEVKGPEGSYALARAGEEWGITAPVKTKAGRWSVDGLLGALEALRLDSVAAEDAKDLKPFGLEKPERSVTLGLEDGSSRTLEIGSKTPEGNHHARVAGRTQVVVIPPAVPGDLAKGLSELRAKRLLDVATYEVEGIEVEGAGQGAKRVYARQSKKDAGGADSHTWKRTAPDAKDVETSLVQDALFEVGGVDVTEFVDAPQPPAAYGLEAPLLSVTLKLQDGKPAQSIAVGQKDGAWYGRRSGDDAVLKLDAEKASKLVETFKKL